MDKSGLFLVTSIAVFIGVCSIPATYGLSLNCSFVPTYNQSLVETVYRYFDEDSDVKIVEYVIRLNVTSTIFDWSKYSDKESYQPWRWFRTQGSGSSRLLLAFYFYYGLFRDYLTFDTRKVQVTLTPVPEGCAESVPKGELDSLLRLYLLRDFDINPKTVRHPYTPSDEVSVCSMYLHNVDGWGRLTYRCCGFDEDDNTNEKTECDDVYNDDWVWALRSLILAFTVILFLILPSLIPGGHTINTYQYSPDEEIEINLVMTSHPESFLNVRNSVILKLDEWRRMYAFRTEVEQLEPEVVYGAHVTRADCCVYNDRIAHRNENPVSFSKSCFDAFVLCKVRHNTPVEECCHTSICGEMCCRGSFYPPWHSWLRALRVIIIMSLLAIPALPSFYAAAAEGLEYQELDKAHDDRGLLRTFNFYPGKIMGKVAVGILTFMYVLNALILVADGATDGRLTRLYGTVLQATQRNKTNTRRKLKRAKVIVRKFFRPVQKYGIYALPIWLVMICLLPVVLILFYIIESPMALLITHASRKLLERMNVITKSDLQTEERYLSFCKVFWFLISLVFVFFVITLGINFIVHLIAMIIVEIVVDASIVYQIIPVIFFLLFYIRDAFHNVGEKYRSHLDIVLRVLSSKEETKLQKETRNPWPLERNTMFQVTPSEATCTEVSKNATPAITEPEASVAPSAPPTATSGPGVMTPLFEVYRGSLWIRLQRAVLMLSKEEVVATPKKFLFQACDMECRGGPGRLEENFIAACIDFLKIAVFLLFVFMAVKAYGSMYSISPTNHLFITLVTGLVPMVLRNIFKNKDEEDKVDETSFRFESYLDQKINSCVQSWELCDLHIQSFQQKGTGTDVIDSQPIKSKMTTSRMANHRQAAAKPILSMLVLDLNQKPSSGNNSNITQKRPKGLSQQNPKQSKSKAANSTGICCSSEVIDGDDDSGSSSRVNDSVDNRAMKESNFVKHPPETKFRPNHDRYPNDRYYTEHETSKDPGLRNQGYESNGLELPPLRTGKWKTKKKRSDDVTPGSEMKDLNKGQPRFQEDDDTGDGGARTETAFTERPKVKRHDSSKDFRRFTTPPDSWYGGDQGHS